MTYSDDSDIGSMTDLDIDDQGGAFYRAAPFVRGAFYNVTPFTGWHFL